ncbi:MAG: CapA family protein [bacterium]
MDGRENRKPLRDFGISLFLCGDVMTGRGIDQVLPHPCHPAIHEPYMKSALGYVELAERKTGPIPRRASFSYVWGDALSELRRETPDLRIINLETAVTTRADYDAEKGINYRMHPANVPALTAAGIDCCVLANNHVLDWGYEGLKETLTALRGAGVKTAGAGADLAEAEAPARFEIEGKGSVLVFSFGSETSGIPRGWGATEQGPGVHLLEDLSDRTVQRISRQVRRLKGKDAVVVASIHWGENWGYPIFRDQKEFAHGLIDAAGVDLIHGHSSHHVKAMEVYRGKLILYGSGDFLNDYEGIEGHEVFRDDLSLMYFARLDPATGKLLSLRMIPMQIRHFRVSRAAAPDALWLRDVLNREGSGLGTRVEVEADGTLTLQSEGLPAS